jgi:uncharacterized protein
VSLLRKALKANRWRCSRAALCLLALGAALVTGAILDASRPPGEQWTVRASVLAIHAYQQIGSPLVTKAGFRCRFTPSCSHFGVQALEKYGIARGSWLTARRIVRCRPGMPMGTVDYP